MAVVSLGLIVLSLFGLAAALRADTVLADMTYRVPSDTKSDAELQAKIEALQQDPHRPRYHFLPRAGEWMNDVHAIFWKGVYHVFYQYEPTRQWERRQCGHARSRDLVHWEELPIAIAPGPGAHDAESVYSGAIFEGLDGRVHFVYDGRPSGAMCHAVAVDDDLIEWQKDANVLCARPATIKGGDAPDIWPAREAYNVVLGSWLPDGATDFRLFTTTDLTDWRDEGSFYRTEPGFINLALPHVFPLDGRTVVTATEHKTYKQILDVGDVEDGVFRLQTRSFYDGKPRSVNGAGKTLVDDRGRRIFLTWIMEDRGGSPYTGPELKNLGWAGCMSLPRVASLAEDGAVLLEPPSEITSLRRDHVRLTDVEFGGPQVRILDGIEGDSLEIVAHLTSQGAHTIALVVRCAPDLSEMARIEVDLANRLIRIDSRYTVTDEPHGIVEAAFGDVRADDVELRVFVDRSVIEVFGNGNRARLTGRVYPARSDSLHIGLVATDGKAVCDRLDAWTMDSILP